jgi:asparagine synthase (glutamine-hydrolysing)
LIVWRHAAGARQHNSIWERVSVCGIIGAAGNIDGLDVSSLLGLLHHRGPDDRGFVAESNVQLGFTRLAIIDVAGGHQPMWDVDGTHCIVFNGEIYNYRALRDELRRAGYAFQSNCDTEVILQGYKHWGSSVLERLSGMFAFVIYDRPQRRLFCGRDRHSKKPFYYFNDGRRFAFASELKPLLAMPFVPPAISRIGLSKYLAYGLIPAPNSIIDGVSKLAGGHGMVVSLDTLAGQVFCYWDLDFRLRPRPEDRMLNGQLDEAAVGRHLIDLLQAATESRLMSEVPLGVFLSGGIDSSTVAALACRLLPPQRVDTFSIGFEDPSYDESAYARDVAAFLGTRHHEQVIGGRMLLDFVPDVINHLDEPIADGSVVPTALLARFARERVTVALGGDGGDELFAGYDTFKVQAPAEYAYRWLPRHGIGVLRALAALLPVSQANISLDFQIRQFLRALEYPPETWHSIWLGLVEPREMHAVFPAGETRPARLYDEVFELLRAIPCGEPHDRLLAIYSKTYLQMILAKVDRMSMKTSLEVRAPFLDSAVVDYVTGLPFSLKFRNGTSKYILKKALRGILPDAIIDRKKKGFGMPIGRWLQSELQGYMRDLLTADHLNALGLNAPVIGRMIDEHTRGARNHRVLLWGLIALVGWHRAIRDLKASGIDASGRRVRAAVR